MKKILTIPLLAGLGLLCACKGKMDSSSADSTTVVESTTKQIKVQKIDTTLNNPKLIKTAEMQFKVKDVRQTGEKISALTASYNGMVIHHVLSSGGKRSQDTRISDDSIMRVTAYNATADMLVKIPPSKMEDFITQVDAMGIHTDSIRMNIEDKTLDYLAAKLRLKNRNAAIVEQGVNGSSVNAKDDLIDRQISNQKVVDSTKNAIIGLHFYEGIVVTRERLASDDISGYNLPVYKQLGNALENGWRVFVTIIVGLANFWVLLPIGLGVWTAVMFYKRKVLAKNLSK